MYPVGFKPATIRNASWRIRPLGYSDLWDVYVVYNNALLIISTHENMVLYG